MKVAHAVKDKLLWVADSVNSNVDLQFISKQTGFDIKSVKAYTATNEASAKYPEKNFLDVTAAQLESNQYEILVLGGGCVDITSLKTDENPDGNINNFRDKTMESAQKLFCLAEASLHEFPSLRKVILFKRTPRMDPKKNDPLSLKTQLSSLADSIYFGLWCESAFKDKIHLGEHIIPLHTINEQQMRGPSGRKMFTRTIQLILKKAGIIEDSENEYLPDGMKEIPRCSERSAYDPLNILRKDINARKGSFSKPKESETISRPSVITRKPSNYSGTLQDDLQSFYSIPVNNPYWTLGN